MTEKLRSSLDELVERFNTVSIVEDQLKGEFEPNLINSDAGNGGKSDTYFDYELEDVSSILRLYSGSDSISYELINPGDYEPSI